MSQRNLVGIVAAIALIGGIALATVIAPPGSGEPKYLQSYPQPRALNEFELSDQRGAPFTNQDLLGHWTLAFVGYTFCPDICPTTLAELRRVYPQLTEVESQDPIQIWFISVDPKRDDTSRLNEYINFFNPEFVATSGEHSQLFPLVRSMGMMYAISDNTENPDYLVDHSSSVIVINPKGQVIGRFKPHLEPGKLAVSDGDQIAADMPIVMAD